MCKLKAGIKKFCGLDKDQDEMQYRETEDREDYFLFNSQQICVVIKYESPPSMRTMLQTVI